MACTFRREPFGANLSARTFRRKPFGAELSARTFRRGFRKKCAKQSTCHFLANLDDRPRNCANLITIRPNPGTIGRIHQKVACALLVIAQNFSFATQGMSCFEHQECPSSNTRNVLLRTKRTSFFEHKECPSSNIRNIRLRTQRMSSSVETT